VVDAGMQTSVDGLFAAGEAASGTFGAYRTARALTEILVQGVVAGESAAARATRVDSTDPHPDEVEAACQKVLSSLVRSAGPSHGAMIDRLESIASESLAVRRCAASIESGLDETVSLRRERLPRLAVQCKSRRYNLGWIQAMQLENQLFCLEAALRAARERAESRGQHLRTDFPGVDNGRRLFRIHLENRSGRMQIRRRPPSIDEIEPPENDFPGVLDYALDCRQRQGGSLH
jgi:succinate dehydrogenase / fumarate reductase flavoprotein subunit